MAGSWFLLTSEPRRCSIISAPIKGLKKIGRGDLLIASIALAHKAVLVTRNLRDYRRIPNLQLANWVD